MNMETSGSTNDSSVSSSFYSTKSSIEDPSEDGHVTPTQICLIGDACYDTAIVAARSFGLPVVTSETADDFADDPRTLMVLEEFSGEEFEKVAHLRWRVLGVPALVECMEANYPLPVSKRPLFSLTLKGVVVYFGGIRDRSLVMELMFMIRSMGGSVRKEPNREATHMIARRTVGSKYEYAVVFMVPVMSTEWVWECWNRRHLCNVRGTDSDLMEFRLKPFLDVRVAFVGFPKSEEQDMVCILGVQGGTAVKPTDPTCTHVVVDSVLPASVPAGVSPECHIVCADWFWTCVQQIVRVPETDFPVPQERRRITNLKRRLSSTTADHAVPSSRRVVDDNDSDWLSRAAFSTPPHGLHSPHDNCGDCYPVTPEVRNRHSRHCEDANLTDDCVVVGESSGRLPTAPAEETTIAFDESPRHPGTPSSESPCSALGGDTPWGRVSLESLAGKPITPRTGAFLELLHTEENYVAILDTILKIRSDALNPNQAGGRLLSETQAKIIFGTFMPIVRTHHTLLDKLRALWQCWDEAESQACIGEVYDTHNPDFLRDYLPFVNGFSDSQETLDRTARSSSRFHAFLRVCRGRPECGRQELRELMIRPVQRLGSTLLLLREILKHTPADSPDRASLESALENLSEVLSVINEDKRKMESLCKVFDIFNLIENCPADVIASHRALALQFEGAELVQNGFSKLGDHLVFFVFSDILLVCKKKSKVVAMCKGQPGAHISDRVLKHVHGKPYKFLQTLPLVQIRRIVDVANSEHVSSALGVVYRAKGQLRQSSSYFQLTDVQKDKTTIISQLAHALAAHTCTPDSDTFVHRETAEEAGISREVLSKQLHKAAQMMVKTQCFVTNALSLGRTPTAKSLRTTSPSTHPDSCGPCAMTTFNSTSQLETLRSGHSLATFYDAEDDHHPESVTKTKSLTTNIMKNM